MAKAFAYLGRQCRFIDGFWEFGEFSENARFRLSLLIDGSSSKII